MSDILLMQPVIVY